MQISKIKLPGSNTALDIKDTTYLFAQSGNTLQVGVNGGAKSNVYTPSVPAAANNGTFSVKTKVGSASAVTAADFTANQSLNDDITFVQGSNVTLTTDTTNRTVTIASTNTWRPLGTSADTACAGNDSRLSNARPASDVYSWAKQSSKPSYSFSEISGSVSSSQLPSYVDDVLEYDTRSAFPATGEGGKIYVDKSNNTSWRWSGSTYTQIKGDLTIGTTSGTVADGKVVNDHINNTSNPHGVTKAQVGLGSVVNTGDSATPVSGGTTKFTTGGAYTELAKKVDKVSGKGLSTNDYTTDEKNKLAGIAAGAEVNVQSDWNATSGDAQILNKPTIPAAVAVKGNAETSYRTGNVNITPANIGLGNVGNFKAVSTAASQGLTATEQANARTNIAAVGETINTTWSNLKSARDNSQLIPGQWYRITDYQTTTTQENTQSAGHQFDVIVRADATNVLNENAYAAKHAGDTYFANSNLDAWELKYCIDNDTNRFAWADSTNGKGVIWWMKDENGNECPYDFKNIMFKWESAISQSGIVANVFYYTFSVAKGTNDATVTDFSFTRYYCYGNKMGVEMSNLKKYLNRNVFRCTANTDYCYSNTFGNNCQSNTFGESCYNNTFGNYCYSNTFGYGCYNNTFGNYCQRNTFGNSCDNNTFGNNCQSNTFGDRCKYNTFGNRCLRITFGTSDTTKTYCFNIIVENGNQNLYIDCSATTSYNSPFQNVKIAQGVNNTFTYKTITHTTAGDTFQTIYQPQNSRVVSV